MTGRGQRGRGGNRPSNQQQRRQRDNFVPAPTPAQSAWGGSPAASHVPAPAPAQSAWGRPAPTHVPAPAPTQSAWGRPSGPAPGPSSAPAFTPAPAPVQSAWGNPSGMNSGAGPSPSRERPQPQQGRSQQQQQPPPQQQQQQQPPPQKPQTSQQAQQQSSNAPRRNGDNGARGGDRGSHRGRAPIPDILKTKPAVVNSKRGAVGNKVVLTANYFRVLKKPTWQIYQYRVDFNPPIESDGFKKKLISEQKANLGGYLFDGTVLYLTVHLNQGETVEFMTKDERDDNKVIVITVKFVKTVSMMEGAAVQILNLILRRSMNGLKLQLVGRNFFDALSKRSLEELKIELWPGYVTSIRQHEQDILLCADTATKVMRVETVYDIMLRAYRTDNFKMNFENEILGIVVLTDFNNKTYRVGDIDYERNPTSTFVRKGQSISYRDYYYEKYKIRIRDLRQPMLVILSKDRDIRAGEDDKIFLVPELCRVTGFSETMRNNQTFMRKVAVYTRHAPTDRITKLNAFSTRLQNSKDSMDNFKQWDFKLDPNLLQIQGRVLPRENVIFGNNKIFPTDERADWSHQFKRTPMFNAQGLGNWVMIVPSNANREINEFMECLKKAANGMQYQLNKPTIMELDQESNLAIVLQKAVGCDPQLVMCILRHGSPDRYSVIKKKCVVECGLASQVILWRTMTPKPGKDWNSVLTVATKVLIQLNAKLGGAPWMVDIPLSGTMIVGFDVCHDTKDKSRSYGALVASMDMKKCQYHYSAVSPHQDGNELSNHMAFNLTKAVKCYYAQHGTVPEKILFYRDGVGEGQTNYVFEHEVKNVLSKLAPLYPNKAVPLTFIIVSKRINTRFFLNGANPRPGTVVDDVITLPERYDFFLASQCVQVGTVSPTNYNVLHHATGIGNDNLQAITYKMCHLYYNWTGTLAVPAVCQYAHKLAFLIGNFVHNAPSAKLEKRLYFL